MSFNFSVRHLLVLLGIFALSGCAAVPSPPHLKPLPSELRATLAKKGLEDSAPIFIRIFKQESLLEVWKAKADGRYYHLKSYPVCKWSGALGPKLKQGDKQAPEGFYNVASGNMNPHSKYHLSFNLGYPNVYDRAHGRTGKHLMVHGDCKSAGCYAMTDALMEEIYLLARDAFIGGQDTIPVHAFPFRLTKANLRRQRNSKWYRFWRSMKEGYDHFEAHKTLPKIDVCNKRYLVNASFIDPHQTIDPALRCPRYRKFVPGTEPMTPRQIMVTAPKPAPVVAAAATETAPAPLAIAPTRLRPAAGSDVKIPAPTMAARDPEIIEPYALQGQQIQQAAAPAPSASHGVQGENWARQTSVQNNDALLFGDTVQMNPTSAPPANLEDLISRSLADNQ